MNKIVQNFVDDIKRKQPRDYSSNELEEYAFDLRSIYQYLDESHAEERQVLTSIYANICNWVNGNKAGAINPSALDSIDKVKNMV